MKTGGLRHRIEFRTGVIWGAYELPDTMPGLDYGQPRFYVMVHPKSADLIRIEWGFGTKGFYLSWGERATPAQAAAAKAALAAQPDHTSVVTFKLPRHHSSDLLAEALKHIPNRLSFPCEVPSLSTAEVVVYSVPVERQAS